MSEENDIYAPQVSHTVQLNENPAKESPRPNTPQWYLDENTPGNGERPQWLPSQFNKASDVGKSYVELQKKLGGFTGAPDKYDLTSLELDESQHLVQEITAVAKELNMSQDGLNKFLGRLASAQEAEKDVHLDEQIKKLGPDGDRMLVEYKNWTKDYLKPEVREVVNEWIKTAEDLRAFNHLMAHTHMSAVPTSQTMNIANKFESVKELRNELTKNFARFQSDKTYQKDWSSRMARAVERDGHS